MWSVYAKRIQWVGTDSELLKAIEIVEASFTAVGIRCITLGKNSLSENRSRKED